MQLRLYNTLTRQKEAFAPLNGRKVGLYVCGVTVYDYSHVGHARVCVVFDVVQRVLRRAGYDLTYVRNFTDVDDKIIRRANENGESCEALTERFIAAFHADMDRLDCQRPDVEPRVTTHMPEIISMIGDIIGRGHAYAVPGTEGDAGGHDVYFEVSTFPDYGALSGRSREDNAEGASDRVQHDPRKRDQADFALWKTAKPGEPSWESPWGRGRPGWHIECSAMSCKHLGPTFDLHGGGKDLVFPHHENEIAQSRAANDGRFALSWSHVGFVTLDAEKMSKSTGNFFTIRDVLERFHPQVLRYFLLTGHYLNPLNFSERSLEEATRRVLSIYEKLAAADELLARYPIELNRSRQIPEMVATGRTELWDALADDFNTPRAFAALSEPLSALGQVLAKPKAAGKAELVAHVRHLVREAADLLGVFQHPAQQIVDEIVDGVRARRYPEGSEQRLHVENLVAKRIEARQAKAWADADAFRDQLLEVGVDVRDGKDGTVWVPILEESRLD